MWNFFRIVLGSLLALFIFSLLCVFFLVSMIGGLAAKDKPRVAKNSVLVLDLSQQFAEQVRRDAFEMVSSEFRDIPGLYDIVRLLNTARDDERIAGVYIIANSNPNGFAANEEIRNALKEFKSGGKFVLAHGDIMTQSAYSVANVADKVYISPQGYFEWDGYNVELAFLKGTLQKLDIEPQIFYAGKFKSATEPFRTDAMTPENRLQTLAWLNDIYNDLLLKTSEARKVDTSVLRQLANDAGIRETKDAVKYGLVDALKYDDEFKDEIKERLKIGKYDRIEFVSIQDYFAAVGTRKFTGDKIALIYAEGNIVDGKSEDGIGADNYRTLLRKARLDRSVKAIVFRINSGGGSAMASEAIWRELTLARKEKPVIVSFGDVAASGGYYIACGADSIFAQPTTITGSIGVFGVIPNMQSFFKNKLGVTFDGVKTAPYADAGAIYRPLNEKEKQMVQASIELIYSQFKNRVAEGRKKDTAAVEEIAQGRVWSGLRAKEIGLIDRFGGLGDAVRAAAAKANLTDYHVREYPEPLNIFERIFGKSEPMNYTDKIRKELGPEQFKLYQELKRMQEMTNSIQARLPFQYFWH